MNFIWNFSICWKSFFTATVCAESSPAATPAAATPAAATPAAATPPAASPSLSSAQARRVWDSPWVSGFSLFANRGRRDTCICLLMPSFVEVSAQKAQKAPSEQNHHVTVWPCSCHCQDLCVFSFSQLGVGPFQCTFDLLSAGTAFLSSNVSQVIATGRNGVVRMTFVVLSSCRSKTIVMLKHCNHTSSNAKLDGVCSQARDDTDFPLPFFLGKPRALQCPTSTYRTV